MRRAVLFLLLVFAACSSESWFVGEWELDMDRFEEIRAERPDDDEEPSLEESFAPIVLRMLDGLNDGLTFEFTDEHFVSTQDGRLTARSYEIIDRDAGALTMKLEDDEVVEIRPDGDHLMLRMGAIEVPLRRVPDDDEA